MCKESNTKPLEESNQKENLLICKECNWKGQTTEIDWEIVETCMGNDKIEVCPACGSYEIKYTR